MVLMNAVAETTLSVELSFVIPSTKLDSCNLCGHGSVKWTPITGPKWSEGKVCRDWAARETLSPGLARTPRPPSAFPSSNTIYDTVVTIGGFGDVLETAVADGLGHTNRSQTDGAGRTLQTVDAESKIAKFQYDANGNVLSSRDANNIGVDAVYDNRDRVTSRTDLEGATLTAAYDKHSNAVVMKDALGKETKSVFDARDRQIKGTDRLGGVTEFVFDENSNLNSLKDAEGSVTSYEYDDRNSKIKETYPDHVPGKKAGDVDYGIVEFSYNGARRLETRTDQQGDVITWVFDRAKPLEGRQ